MRVNFLKQIVVNFEARRLDSFAGSEYKIKYSLAQFSRIQYPAHDHRRPRYRGDTPEFI
jgi:hypothetical protein